MCSSTPTHPCAHSLPTHPSRHRPRAFFQPPPTWQSSPMQLFSFAAALPPLDSAANWHSNPIAHRVRRKRQRLPPSLLIENASDRVPLRCQSSCPRRLRSSLATNRMLMARGPFHRTNVSDAGSNSCSMSALVSKRQLSRDHSGKATIRPGNESALKQSSAATPGWGCRDGPAFALRSLSRA